MYPRCEKWNMHRIEPVAAVSYNEPERWALENYDSAKSPGGEVPPFGFVRQECQLLKNLSIEERALYHLRHNSLTTISVFSGMPLLLRHQKDRWDDSVSDPEDQPEYPPVETFNPRFFYNDNYHPIAEHL